MEIRKIGDAYPTRSNSAAGRIYSPKGAAPTLRTPSGGGDTPMIGINVSGHKENGVTDTSHCLNANDQRKVFGANQEHTLVADEKTDIAHIHTEKYGDVSVRRLTPKECFRLQGWRDEKYERAAMVNSETQLYKQAGNGVTVNVIRAIAEKLE